MVGLIIGIDPSWCFHHLGQWSPIFLCQCTYLRLRVHERVASTNQWNIASFPLWWSNVATKTCSSAGSFCRQLSKPAPLTRSKMLLPLHSLAQPTASIEEEKRACSEWVICCHHHSRSTSSLNHTFCFFKLLIYVPLWPTLFILTSFCKNAGSSKSLGRPHVACVHHFGDHGLRQLLFGKQCDWTIAFIKWPLVRWNFPCDKPQEEKSITEGEKKMVSKQQQ